MQKLQTELQETTHYSARKWGTTVSGCDARCVYYNYSWIVNSKHIVEVTHYSTPIQESDALHLHIVPGSDSMQKHEVTCATSQKWRTPVPVHESDALGTLPGSDSLQKLEVTTLVDTYIC